MPAKKISEKVQSLDLPQLVDIYEETSKTEGKRDSEVKSSPIIRGAIIDELEMRDTTKFLEWLDSGEDSPRKFFSDLKKEYNR